jgi:hypothetical protein
VRTHIAKCLVRRPAGDNINVATASTSTSHLRVRGFPPSPPHWMRDEPAGPAPVFKRCQPRPPGRPITGWRVEDIAPSKLWRGSTLPIRQPPGTDAISGSGLRAHIAAPSLPCLRPGNMGMQSMLTWRATIKQLIKQYLIDWKLCPYPEIARPFIRRLPSQRSGSVGAHSGYIR